MENLQWQVHTPNLLREIQENGGPGMGIMKQPIRIFAGILAKVAERASELHDRELDTLMMRLALYEVADPESSSYDQKIVDDYIHGKNTTS